MAVALHRLRLAVRVAGRVRGIDPRWIALPASEGSRMTAPDNRNAATTWRDRRRARRLHKAELRLADAEYRLHKWGFANTPSEDDHAERRIGKLRQKVEALRVG